MHTFEIQKNDLNLQVTNESWESIIFHSAQIIEFSKTEEHIIIANYPSFIIYWVKKGFSEGWACTQTLWWFVLVFWLSISPFLSAVKKKIQVHSCSVVIFWNNLFHALHAMWVVYNLSERKTRHQRTCWLGIHWTWAKGRACSFLACFSLSNSLNLSWW